MKKVLWLIVCLMTMVIGLSSCGGDIVSKARDNYKQRLTAIAKDHDVEVSFNNENILIQKNDIVVISFTANAHDKYGKYGTLDFISVYAIDENGKEVEVTALNCRNFRSSGNNQVNVSSTGVMTVNSVSTDLLFNGTNTLIIDGGSAS